MSICLAAPYNGKQFHLQQPDGTHVPVMVFGDEYYQRVETPDGHTLVRNEETGWICYATLSDDSTELVPSDIVYQAEQGLSKTSAMTKDVGFSKGIRISRESRLTHRSNVRKLLGGESSVTTLPAGGLGKTTAAPSVQPLAGEEPVVGAYIGLTICIDFSDEPLQIPIDSVRALLNEPGYSAHRNNGSVRDYYLDVSGGKVDYSNIVVGYYRAKKDKAYYDSRYQSFGTTALELIEEALEWLRDEEGFDFSQLSTYRSSRGERFRALNILYAGSPTQGWSEGLWPHQGYMYSFSVNGVDARRYQISSMDDKLSIGTICHENGHMLFEWPDLYDYGGESAGVGVYCIMGFTGDVNPVSPCAYLRDLCGWDAVTDITTMAEGTVLSLLPNANTSFIYRNVNNENEMFYVEACRRAGRSQTLPDSGFMIWHVDREGSNDFETGSSREHYLVSLEQADGNYDLEYGMNEGRRGDLFRGGYVDEFDDATEPDALWWNGSPSGMAVRNMSEVGDTMSISIGEMGDMYHSVTVTSRGKGAVAPSGVISVVDGNSLTIIALPDSGYRTDEVRINDAVAGLTDTLELDAVDEDLTVSFDFGLKAALSIVEPFGDEILYAEDTVRIRWKVKEITVSGIVLSFSSDSGKTFTSIADNLPAADTVFMWVVPTIESDGCIVKIADADGKPTSQTPYLTIRKKPSIQIAAQTLQLSVQTGRKLSQSVTVTNDGTGTLSLRTAVRSEMKNVLINEMSIGSVMVLPDGVELWNRGRAIDISGWQLLWEDYRSPSMTYVFDEGTVLQSGQTFTLFDGTGTDDDTTAFIGYNLPWRPNDSLQLMIMLLDQDGNGIDFIKTTGVPSQPPPGTGWSGNGIDLCDAFIYRTGSDDKDAADGWECGPEGTMMEQNDNQKTDTTSFVAATLSSGGKVGDVTGGGNGMVTVTVDAVNKPVGNYVDTIVIYHNDPDVPSPMAVPCEVTVTPYVGVITQRIATVKSDSRKNGDFSVDKNMVAVGEPVRFMYRPAGNERSMDLQIFSKTGSVLYSKKTALQGVSVFNREPVRVLWNPFKDNGYQSRGTLFARLIVHFADTSVETYSLLFGVQ